MGLFTCERTASRCPPVPNLPEGRDGRRTMTKGVSSQAGDRETAPVHQHPYHSLGRALRMHSGLPGPSNLCILIRSGGAGGRKSDFLVTCVEGNRRHDVFRSIAMCRTLSVRHDDNKGG